jgi:hypothetical protein
MVTSLRSKWAVGPAVAHARQLKSLGLSGKDLSRRGHLKVEAQYEAIASIRRSSRPGRIGLYKR